VNQCPIFAHFAAANEKVVSPLARDDNPELAKELSILRSAASAVAVVFERGTACLADARGATARCDLPRHRRAAASAPPARPGIAPPDKSVLQKSRRTGFNEIRTHPVDARTSSRLRQGPRRLTPTGGSGLGLKSELGDESGPVSSAWTADSLMPSILNHRPLRRRVPCPRFLRGHVWERRVGFTCPRSRGHGTQRREGFSFVKTACFRNVGWDNFAERSDGPPPPSLSKGGPTAALGGHQEESERPLACTPTLVSDVDGARNDRAG